jgi:predicted subunit of tRNA(5-methylaminomethyl-2-thiouridylate) methyltransferase
LEEKNIAAALKAAIKYKFPENTVRFIRIGVLEMIAKNVNRPSL